MRTQRYALAALLIAAIAFPLQLRAQSAGPLAYAEHRSAASAAFQSGDYEAAISHARSALSHSDWDGGLWLLLARSARRKGESTLAFTAYREALARGVGGGLRDYDLGLAIATLHGTTGAPDSALGLVEAALASRAPRARLSDDSALRSLSSRPAFRGIAPPAPAAADNRAAGWQGDIAFLVAEAQRLNPAPSAPARATAFTAQAEALAAAMPGLSDEAVAAGIQRLLAALGDGHTVLYPMPTERVRFRSVPFALYRFSDGVHVVAAEGQAAALVGARVDSIGGLAAEEALRRLRPYVSRDNDMGYDFLGSYFLAMPMMLNAIGAAAETAAATYHLTLPDGTERRVTLEATSPRHLPRLRAPAGSSAPRWLRQADRAFWVERLGDSRVVYAQVNQIGNTETESLRQFAMRVRDSLTSANATALILDLRHNNGGNNFLMPPLVELAAWFEFTGEGRQVIALTSRITFSAAQNLVNALDRFTGTTFAGEPSGSKPNFAGEDNPVVLPWSGLMVSIANRYWADSYPEDARQWVAPDLPHRLSAADFFAGRDTLLDAVVEYATTRRVR